MNNRAVQYLPRVTVGRLDAVLQGLRAPARLLDIYHRGVEVCWL